MLTIPEAALAFGGEAKSHARAQEDAWRHVLTFVKEELSTDITNQFPGPASSKL